NFYCIGACLRDDKGQFVAAFAKRFEGQPAIDEAEAVGVLEALKWMQSSHITSSHIETDNLHVAQALGNNAKNNSEFGAVIKIHRSLLTVIICKCTESLSSNKV
ncbi:60S ribosomal protein L23, partial [Trifolium medium]|nr:60S ribosomal protein L23 [Trifolium medium]